MKKMDYRLTLFLVLGLFANSVMTQEDPRQALADMEVLFDATVGVGDDLIANVGDHLPYLFSLLNLGTKFDQLIARTYILPDTLSAFSSPGVGNLVTKARESHNRAFIKMKDAISAKANYIQTSSTNLQEDNDDFKDHINLVSRMILGTDQLGPGITLQFEKKMNSWLTGLPGLLNLVSFLEANRRILWQMLEEMVPQFCALKNPSDKLYKDFQNDINSFLGRINFAASYRKNNCNGLLCASLRTILNRIITKTQC